jgi:hypothetical protein
MPFSYRNNGAQVVCRTIGIGDKVERSNKSKSSSLDGGIEIVVSVICNRLNRDNIREYSSCFAYNTISIRVAWGLVGIYMVIKTQSILWGGPGYDNSRNTNVRSAHKID